MLRRYCGLSAREVTNELPAWEVDLLLDGITKEMKERREEG